MTYDPRTFIPEAAALVAANDRVPEQRAGEDVREVAVDMLTRLRDEVIAVVAEGISEQPDYERIAALYDDAASNVLPSDIRHNHDCSLHACWRVTP